MNNRKHVLGLLFISFLFFLFLHQPYIELDIQGIHTWRQTQTMWNINNFVRHDFNILNPRLCNLNGGGDNIVRLEFPIMQWGIAGVLKLTGEHILTVRLLMFLIGVMTVTGLFFLTYLLYDNYIISLFVAFLAQCSPLFFYYSICPMPDMLALSASVWYFGVSTNEYEIEELHHCI